jgi:hypothetical protein
VAKIEFRFPKLEKKGGEKTGEQEGRRFSRNEKRERREKTTFEMRRGQQSQAEERTRKGRNAEREY